MHERDVSIAVDTSPLRAFMETVRKVLGHDLRTPLGTIVNYAAVLEEDAGQSGGDSDRVRGLTERIRLQAVQTADMLETLLEATLLAARPVAGGRSDPLKLLHDVLAEVDPGTSLTGTMACPNDGIEIELDSELVAFVWRAFLAIEQGARGSLPKEVRLRVERGGDHDAVLELQVGPALDLEATQVEVDAFLRAGGHVS